MLANLIEVIIIYFMKLNKKVFIKRNISEEDDNFVEASPEERLNMVWDITAQLWYISSRGEVNVSTRLQRNIANIKR